MVYMYHSFLIHSSADGHVGCFHVLAMINSAAMNIGVHMSLSDLVSLVCMPRSVTQSFVTDSSSALYILCDSSKCNYQNAYNKKWALESECCFFFSN